MENEQFFLFVFWASTPHPDTVKGTTIVRSAAISMLRTSLQRPIRQGELFKRVPIDFDPLGKHIVFVVSCYFTQSLSGIIITDIIRPCYIFENEIDAQEAKKRLENGEFKDFIEKKEKLEKIEINALTVTVD